MIHSPEIIQWLSNAWAVLLLFIIPIGGGIPAGVVLAQARGFEWPTMMILYLISDIILALVFEPVMLLIVYWGRRSEAISRQISNFKKHMAKQVTKYGVNPSPFALIMVAFGVDPMTGRTVALAAGHNFISGWALAITGDMMFFTVLMASTLWLNKILGDGTWAAIIVTLGMMVMHSLVQRWRARTK